ncbi:hypothetical protein THAOC_06846 [Thalassiosira oceanica]|uniref:Uncharacterized protein n=1 Tax=Thalassiosira oceanica TaxID=159749 RepID=K0SZF4_THAOC|nr:hypothetical protein THAOC_06846 [Thalassiosira oceanica]|eukprot:EJK71688.1 hypothetical protein THAOC_06846 [Thalassiosira oceanica]
MRELPIEAKCPRSKRGSRSLHCVLWIEEGESIKHAHQERVLAIGGYRQIGPDEGLPDRGYEMDVLEKSPVLIRHVKPSNQIFDKPLDQFSLDTTWTLPRSPESTKLTHRVVRADDHAAPDRRRTRPPRRESCPSTQAEEAEESQAKRGERRKGAKGGRESNGGRSIQVGEGSAMNPAAAFSDGPVGQSGGGRSTKRTQQLEEGFVGQSSVP